jgi:hypothetical protein
MRLLELKNKAKVVVVYGGGFQPFHQGHMSSYLQAKQEFPGADFYVAASNDTKTRPIPFAAKQFLAQQAGVVDPFVQVSQPINPREILANYNPEQDILILVRSERDPMSYTKKDGTPGYYQPFVSVDQCEPFSKHGYILVTKKHVFDVNGEEVYSGSQVRTMYAEADDAGKANIIKQLYPKARDQKKIKQVFDQYLSQQGVAEGEVVPLGKKHRGDLDSVNSCPKCGGDLQGGTYMGQRVKVCQPCKQVYLPPNSGIDQQGNLNEFAPDDGSGGEEDMLLKFARMWYNGDLHTQQQVERTLARAGWEIGELESEEGGAFVVQSGDEHGDTYIGFSPADLIESVTEGYGKYWCSTDKRWKQRQGPKQTRKVSEDLEAQLDEIDRRGFLKGLEQDYLSQIPDLAWKPLTRSVWNTIQDEGLDEEQDAPEHTDWVMASLSIDPKDAQALQEFDSDTIEDFNRFDIHLKSRYPGLTDLIDYDIGTVTIVKPIQVQGVAEGYADQQRKIFKKNGKPVGEVGIDAEASPGNGQWYMTCYGVVSYGGYDSYEEAVAELKHCLKQGVAEAATDDPKFQKMMGAIQKNTPDPVSGYVAVSYASERPSKRIRGATVNGRALPATTDDPGQLIKDLKFTPDRIEQQLTVIGQKYGWDLVEPGQGQGYTEVYFDTNKEFTTHNQKQLAAMIVKTVSAINKYFSDMNRGLQATGLPAYQTNVWQGMGANGNIRQIDDVNKIAMIAQGKTAESDAGPAIGRMILKYIPEYEAENDELGYDPEDFANAKKVASIYIAKGERAGLQAQGKLDSHVSEMIDELLSDHGGSGLRTIWDLDEQGVAEAEGDAKGVPHVTRELLQHIIQQVGKEGAHAIIKSLEWGDGAAKELLHLIVKDLENNVSMAESVKQRLDKSCWKGYRKQGTKMKGDTRVNNCVKEEIEEHIVKVKGGYELKSKHGDKNLGKYPTKAGAEKREKQVNYFKYLGDKK